MEELDVTGYLAPEGLEHYVREEAGAIEAEHGRLILGRGEPRPTVWSQNVWMRPVRIRLTSISDAAKQLRALQRSWVHLPSSFHRRATLIQEQLPHVSQRPLRFPERPPSSPLGSWVLVDRETIIASPSCSSPFPHGVPSFEERKSGPPSRAYLKLWEVFTRLGFLPKAGSHCLDLGAAPGGWTWALAEIGCRVTAVDRAPIAPALRRRPNVESAQRNAFTVRPTDFGAIDWVFSDLVCYPEKLLAFVEGWLEEVPEQSFVCTIKFQGHADRGVIDAFARIDGASIVHLAANKHELTWVRRGARSKTVDLPAATRESRR